MALTEGSFQTAATEGTPVNLIFVQAYEQAARNLLAEQGVYNAVTRPNAAGAPKQALTILGVDLQ